MTYVTVDIELDEFSDEDIRAEYDERELGIDDRELLTRIWIHDREGRKEAAYTLMREYVLEKLNKVV